MNMLDSKPSKHEALRKINSPPMSPAKPLPKEPEISMPQPSPDPVVEVSENEW